MSFGKNGVISVNMSDYHYLVPNFTETKAASGWTLGGSVNSSGVAVLTGTGPAITSPSFTVGTDEIVVVEFSLSLPTVSQNDGIYLGIAGNTNTILYTYNFSTNAWNSGTDNANSSWNTYFISSYNSSDVMTVKSYVLGSNVDISIVPAPERSLTTKDIRAIKLKNYTSTNIRAGYNTNTSMVINVSDFRIYPLSRHSFSDTGSSAFYGKGYLLGSDIIEY